MTFAVLVTYCMIALPAECVERSIPLVKATELTCYAAGQPEAIKALLPGWRITRYGCRRVRA